MAGKEAKGNKEQMRKIANSKRVNLNTTILVTKLNGKCLNIPIKRDCQT